MGKPTDEAQKNRSYTACSVAKFDAMMAWRREFAVRMMVALGARFWPEGTMKTLPPLAPCPDFVRDFKKAFEEAEKLWDKESPDGGAD
jgi:hypothetical protein